ncbi:MAG: CxxC-x17-CxxC domain-containing protein [Eubacteriales bacterium]
MFEDKQINCKDCGKEYIFSIQEQESFAERGLEHAPSRCPDCRNVRKSKRIESGGGSFNQSGTSRFSQQTYKAICAECGSPTEIPFKPKEDRPVYCRQCYRTKKRRY